MNTLWHLLGFELRFYMKRISTHVYFGIFFAMAVALVLFIGGVSDSVTLTVGGSDGLVYINSPYVTLLLASVLSLFALMVTAAIAGHAGQRDFATGIYPLFFTTPIEKWQYFGGRLLAVVFVNIYIYSGIGIGLLVGHAMPFLERDSFGPFHLLTFIAPYISIIIPNILLSATLFFSLAALTRKMLPNYIGGVVLLVGYLLGGNLFEDIENRSLAILTDPFGLRAISDLTEYWTSFEKNTLFVFLDGVVGLNRALWLGAAVVVFLFSYRRFRMEEAVSNPPLRLGRVRPSGSMGAAFKPATSGGDASSEDCPGVMRPSGSVWAGLKPAPAFGFSASFAQYLKLLRRALSDIVGNVYFVAILCAGILFLALSTPAIGKMFGTSTWPVTYQVLEVVGGTFSLFVLMIITFYAGEAVWHERDLRIDQVIDSSPVSSTIPFLAKLSALGLTVALLLVVVMVSGIVIQLFHGYTHFEIALYLQTLFGLNLIDYLILCVLAMAVHVIVNHKYAGHLIMVLYYGVLTFRSSIGLEHNMWVYDADSGITYSDMNGFGPFLEPYLWFKLYWAAFALLLAIVSRLLWVRGRPDSFRARLALARLRLTRPLRIGLALTLLLIAGVSSYVYYNTNVLNTYRSSFERDERTAETERLYKQYEGLPQPRITSASVEVDLYPNRGEVDSRGTLELKNKHESPIDRLYLRLPLDLTLNKLELADTWQQELLDLEHGFAIYKLEMPLEPGAETALQFDFSFPSQGFTNQVENTVVVENGSFVSSPNIVPGLGYWDQFELENDTVRKRHKLEPRERMSDLDDQKARENNYIANDADWIDFEAVVSTVPDQIAIAPGYLQREWTEKGRRYFHYAMDAPILNFYSFLSARYEVTRDRWRDVNIEVYYHPEHAYNVDRMIDSVKASLDYYTENFSPYQHKQVRILEFPRYSTFAQSFPNTIPYSESIGFIARIGDDDIDYPFYVTAHEVAHQWWAHQLIGADVQGATILSESLAQYSSLMVMEREYGREKIRRFLEYELNSYLRGRSAEKKKELPLLRVENQSYIHYRKGSLVFYALRDYMGEEWLNSILSKYLLDNRWQEPPYTYARELLARIREKTPEDMQYLLEDFFETITLYENKTDSASWTRLEDGRYQVKLEVESRKVRSDEVGREQEVPMNDLIEIGVFEEDKDAPPLYLEKRKLTGGKIEIDLIVDKKPHHAGIDPFNKLIDRHPSDNTREAEEG